MNQLYTPCSAWTNEYAWVLRVMFYQWLNCYSAVSAFKKTTWLSDWNQCQTAECSSVVEWLLKVLSAIGSIALSRPVRLFPIPTSGSWMCCQSLVSLFLVDPLDYFPFQSVGNWRCCQSLVPSLLVDPFGYFPFQPLAVEGDVSHWFHRS